MLARHYADGLKDYASFVDASLKDIAFAKDSMAVDKPHTIILVIGESSARDMSRIYNSRLQYDDTPWQSRESTNKDFVFFDNVYATHCQTTYALEKALTEDSLYSNKGFNHSMNIIDLARQKGYKTYWITNTDLSNKESEFGILTDRSDVVIWEPGGYDHKMLDYLKKINPNENNFVVIRGNGCHVKYESRYPEDKVVFTDNTTEAKYANATHYVDEFLQKVFEYGTDRLNLQAMVFFSDHGEDMKTDHSPGDKKFTKVRIPMFIYMGEAYQQQNIEKYGLLRDRKHSFYTNDMVYNTLVGLLNAESNFYNVKEDLTSPQYGMELNELLTFNGGAYVKDDPYIK